MLHSYKKKISSSHELNTYSNLDKFIFLLYTMYFILKPIYLWSSGLPQISDMILLLLILVYVIKKKFTIVIYFESKKFLMIGMLFVLYVVLINSVWVLILNTADIFIITSLFYVYNFIVVVLVLVLYSDYKEKIIEVTYKATLISVFIQVFMFFVGGGFLGGRMTVGFNNPNQLGYYALLVTTILMFSSKRITVKTEMFVMGLISSLILAAASLSKATIISIVCCVFIFFFTKNENKRFKRNFTIIVVVSAILIIYIYQTTSIIQNNQLFQSVQNRINAVGSDSDDSFAGRGYERITEHPEYWIFGAGEGEFPRLGFGSHELHSTLGNIQVSYGIIGLILFLRFMYLGLKNDKYRSWYIIIVIMTYGLTHNGIRNSLFWILLALIASQNKYTSHMKNQKIIGEIPK